MDKLSETFDECLAWIRGGEEVQTCLPEHPQLRQQLVPLLHMALSIETIPKATPSDEFRRISHEHLTAWIRQEAIQTEKLHQASWVSNSPGKQRIRERAFNGP